MEMSPAKLALLIRLAALPDEAFGWLVLALPPKAMAAGSPPYAQVWPDGIGGFSSASRQAINDVRAAAQGYLEEQR